MFSFQQPTHTAVSVCHITATREVLVCPVIPRKEKENLLLFNTCGLFFYNRGVKLIAGGPEKTLITVTPISIATEHYLNVLAVVMVMCPKVCDIICMPHTLNTKKQRTSRWWYTRSSACCPRHWVANWWRAVCWCHILRLTQLLEPRPEKKSCTVYFHLMENRKKSSPIAFFPSSLDLE